MQRVDCVFYECVDRFFILLFREFDALDEFRPQSRVEVLVETVFKEVTS